MNTDFKKSQLKNKLNYKVSYSWGFSNLNYILFTLGLISIFIGYFVMVTGKVNSFQSLTVAPIFLFVGYIILIPISLIVEKGKD